ncbi:MAG: response regulator, partial [Geobacteraceae bacterium]|nr:response regulator [Geobacteraceae bacterium]
TFSHSEAARLVSDASPGPVYSVYAAQLGNGVVGGRMMKGQTQGFKAAELAVSIINGEQADNLPVVTSSLSQPMFDDRMLRRFGIDTSRLPADSVLINKPLSTFAISKKAVWLSVAFTLFCITGMTVLFLNIQRRRRLEEMLRLKIDQYQESQEELEATEEMLRAQVDDFMQSQDELQATEEMLREQICEYQTTHDQLQDTKEKLRIQLEVAEESSQKFRAVFEYSPITVALTTLQEGTFSEVNQAFIDMFGYSRAEAIGRTSLELGVWLHESDRNRYLQQLKADGHVHNFETEMRRKQGDVFTVLFSGVQLEIAGKSSILSAVMDITEQKRLQNQLHQAQKMDVVGQLAGGIAHDFNNMLAGIMAAAELLKRRMSHDDKNSRLAETIIEAATRSADLTSELLTFSRKGTAVSAPIRINDTITAVMSLLKRTIDRQILLEARLDQNDPVIMGDQTQLQNALLNLGVNARDAMPRGGTLTFTTTIKNLDEASFRSMGIFRATGRYLEIAVSDTGVGMTNDVMEHIFEPFFTTKDIGKGTGLGLASVYGAVRNHDGEISVQSQPGIGSVFRIFLPLVCDNPDRQHLPDEAVGGSGGILLVDDEEMLRSVGRDLLEDLGYTVFLAQNGEDALEVYADHRREISLVILDMIMPKMGGKEAFLRLREQSPELKVLFCSGFSREGTGDELAGLGADGFIQKPYNRTDLSRKVSELMGQPHPPASKPEAR